MDQGIVLQHDDDAPPALLGEWLERRGIAWRLVDVPSGGLPALGDASWLVVLGSHRSARDAEPAWIPAEIDLLREAIGHGLPCLGICFGGQALALALDGEVEPSRPPEAGWDSRLEILDEEIPPGPWLNFHLERFTLPPGATLLARSAAGPSAYRHGLCLGVQFHPEATPETADAWAADYRGEHPWIDVERLARDGADAGAGARRRAFELFDRWWARAAGDALKGLNSDQDLPQSSPGGSAVADYAKDVLVSTDWVAEHLDDDSIRIVEVDENPALYAEGHIPGAIGFDWRADLQDQLKRDFLSPEEFGALMGSRGISNGHTIVLYGDRNNWFAAYTYWYFLYYGHDRVRLLNGPREKWIEEGRETETEPPSHPEASFATTPGDEAIRARREEVFSALDSETSLVDVRSPQEYSGELIAMAGYEQEGAQRAGHIPGAASVPWAKAVNDDGTFRSADELRELYTGAGVISDGKPIVAYCRIGERSAHTWFVLHELLGEGDVKNYDGSWTEWGNLVDVPIEKDV